MFRSLRMTDVNQSDICHKKMFNIVTFNEYFILIGYSS